MRLLSRLYLQYEDIYKNQANVKLSNPLSNIADIFSRETMPVLAEAINKLCKQEVSENSVSDQKSGLKISLLNLIKLTGQMLIGHFLVLQKDSRSEKVVDFLKVFKLFENEMFGDAYYDLNFRKNRTLRKPINLPKTEDVKMLMDECCLILKSIDLYNHPSDSFVLVRSAVITILILFCARRGGEPVRLELYQWQEAIDGEWVAKEDLPDDFDQTSMLITYQTGKGGDHLVPVIFPGDTIAGMKYITNPNIRLEAGVNLRNNYVFPSTQNSLGHASGWHAINDILLRLNKKGAINATRNRHRVASLLAKLHLSQKEKDLIFQHFGHSEHMNKNVYQAPPGSQQLQSTGRLLSEISSNT